MKFSEHKAIKNADGTYTIEAVPVFELGEHKGFNYDEAWAAEALQNFATLKEKKRLPRVILGHTAEGVEKKAFGFWDNLKLIGKQFVTDLIRIPEAIFNEIKNLEWPGRSVELNPEKKKFTALALLGGSEPYFENLEPLEIIFEEENGGQWIDFTSGKQFNNKLKEPGMADQKTFTEEQHAAILEAAKKGFSEEFIAQFKAKHGLTPEEALLQAKAHEAQVKKFSDDLRKEKIAAFCERMKKAGLAPALADAYATIRPHFNDTGKVAKFGEGGDDLSSGAYLDKFFETLLSYAKEGKLLVPDGEVGGKTNQSFAEGAQENTEAGRRKYFAENRAKFEKLGLSEEDYVKYGE